MRSEFEECQVDSMMGLIGVDTDDLDTCGMLTLIACASRK